MERFPLLRPRNCIPGTRMRTPRDKRITPAGSRYTALAIHSQEHH